MLNSNIANKLKNVGGDSAGFAKFLQHRAHGVNTSFPRLDRHITGLHGIVSILGEPGSYKSTFCLQTALHHAQTYGPVLYYDRENGINRIRLRLICALFNIPVNKFYTLPQEEIDSYLAELEKLKIFVFHEMTLEELSEAVDYFVEHTSNGKVMLVMDSLQSMPSLNENKRYSIDHWLVGLDKIKLNHEQNLVILSPVEKRKGAYDSQGLDGGKESGSIEYKSEIIFNLSKPKDVETGRPTGFINLTCLKDRDGPSNYIVTLKPTLVIPHDRGSFCYRLEEVEEIEF